MALTSTTTFDVVGQTQTIIFSEASTTLQEFFSTIVFILQYNKQIYLN